MLGKTISRSSSDSDCLWLWPLAAWLKAWLFLLALLVTLPSFGYSTFHTFTFDALRDSKDVEVLQYRYGDDGGFNTRSTQTEIQTEKVIMSRNTTGDMIVGKDLYVKWRIKSTGQVLEDTVDLQSLLPLSIKNNDLRFIIEGAQLYVYLISHEPVRDVMSAEVVNQIRRTHITPREKAFSFLLRRRVMMIYPEKQIDPHLPADLRK